MTLLFTLAMVALLAMVSVAFIALSAKQMSTVDASSNLVQVDLLGQMAEGIVVQDLVDEIAAASRPPEVFGSQRYFFPLRDLGTDEPLGMMPSQVGFDPAPGQVDLLKVSRVGAPGWTSYGSDFPPVRAHGENLSTRLPSQNQRRLPPPGLGRAPSDSQHRVFRDELRGGAGLGAHHPGGCSGQCG